MMERHERHDAILRLAAGDGTRLAMRGNSMRPLFRESMVLKTRAYEGTACIGDVVVFRRQDILVAHRVVAHAPSGLQTAGDAQPWIVEDVPHREVLAVVDGVFAGAEPTAARVDGLSFTMRGALYARAHRLRVRLHRAETMLAAAAQFAFPWQRPRVQPALVAALGAIVQGDEHALAAAVARVPAQRFALSAERHRCAEAVLEALRGLDTDPTIAEVRALLAPPVRQNAVQALLQRGQVVTLAENFTAAGIPFALLKGAARAFRDDPALAHPSCDIDVLIPRDAIDDAVTMLRRRGYGFRSNEKQQLRYRRRHHHLAPLFPSGPGLFVELHTSLAPPGTLGLATDWEALHSHVVTIETRDGTARCFDAFGSALHYGIHAIGLERLRDLLFCARLLRELDGEQRAELRRLAAVDAIDPVRFGASFALAARIAGLDWETPPEVERYLKWASRRDDMPKALRLRTRGVEAWFAAGSRLRLEPRILMLDDPAPRQIVGRAGLIPIALGYAAAMAEA
jgi:hypothetical protein